MSYLKNIFTTSGLIDRRYLVRQAFASCLALCAFASFYGAYIQLGIFSYRTLLFPALFIWTAIGITLWDLARFLRDRRRKEVLIHFASIALLIVLIDGIDQWRAGWESKVVSRLGLIVSSGEMHGTDHLRHVEFVPPDLKKELENLSCKEPSPERRSLGFSTYQMTCGMVSLLIDIVPLWSKADLHVRRERHRGR
jgi:hypothetical protein